MIPRPIRQSRLQPDDEAPQRWWLFFPHLTKPEIEQVKIACDEPGWHKPFAMQKNEGTLIFQSGM